VLMEECQPKYLMKIMENIGNVFWHEYRWID